jgi:hypothetical protein
MQKEGSEDAEQPRSTKLIHSHHTAYRPSKMGRTLMQKKVNDDVMKPRITIKILACGEIAGAALTGLTEEERQYSEVIFLNSIIDQDNTGSFAAPPAWKEAVVQADVVLIVSDIDNGIDPQLRIIAAEAKSVGALTMSVLSRDPQKSSAKQDKLIAAQVYSFFAAVDSTIFVEQTENNNYAENPILEAVRLLCLAARPKLDATGDDIEVLREFSGHCTLTVGSAEGNGHFLHALIDAFYNTGPTERFTRATSVIVSMTTDHNTTMKEVEHAIYLSYKHMQHRAKILFRMSRNGNLKQKTIVHIALYPGEALFQQTDFMPSLETV